MSAATIRPKIAIIFYSTWGHAKTLAESIQAGVAAAGGEGTLYQVAETLPQAVLEKMHAAPHPFPGIPTITAEDLPNFDGLLFGIPTRFGTPAAQVKALFDSTGGLWAKGSLVGKHAGLFFGTGTQGAGQETTALTALPFFVHHGILYVPLGYSSPLLQNMEEVHGGSPWGAGYLAGGDGSRAVSTLEKSVGEHQGKYFTSVVKTHLAGKAALEGLENGK